MIRNTLSGRGLHRWRAALIVIFVIPAIVCGSAVKLAHASFHKARPMLSDGVDDDTTPPILCTLVEATTKEFSPTKARSPLPTRPQKLFARCFANRAVALEHQAALRV
jgi:hypothetical protein